VAAEYAYVQGTHLFRARDVNAPLPGSGMRPDPRFTNVIQVESTARSRGHALTATMRARIRGLMQITAQYTLARTLNDTRGQPGGGVPFSLPADNFDLGREFGPADFDQRHRLNATASADLPGAWRVAAVGRFGSALPYDITTGVDTNGDTVLNDRPPGVSRNAGRGSAMARLDVRLTKAFEVHGLFAALGGDDGTLEINIDAFNALNRVNFRRFVGAQTSPFFGRAAAAFDPRAMQISMRYSF
jgi:hypothetical protein